ncbi:hypothetical protein AB0M10_24370 [Streptomyces sp. NPDC051840]|uniref:hypothetical protein n=1 Tax=unclassified Streptomyces TaxID=2593676 RepID=UPI00341F5B95
MMPPNCDICRVPSKISGSDPSDFTLVEFRPARTYPEDWTGHPEHCVWFCSTHLPLAEGLTHLPALEALRQILANQRRKTEQGMTGPGMTGQGT